ncbi:retinitis pigmentosa 1-like 1 protein [Odocoileus virginianus]|uniref:Retinitis pigmentosa 1-like 1 protein n=1 Tax=Odocoileus virginianus TaxID=9874 RepID=A0ABM4HQV0_ODOVR
MSATEEHDWIPGGQDRAGGGAGHDPSLPGVQASAWEGMEGVEEATALLASLEVSRALPGEQGWPQATVEEKCDREPLEEEEMEEDVEEMEEDEEESEAHFELEDVEEEEHLSGEVEEEEDTEEEDENEQEGAAVVTGLGFSAGRFGPLFWSQVDSFIRNLHNNKHVLFRPHADRLMARGCSQPPSDPGEGPVPPQEQEDLGEGGKVLQGLDSAADFKLGYFPCQLLTPKSAPFCPNDEGEYQYENADEEEEDGNEKPEGL